MLGHLEYVKLLTGPRAGEAAYAVIRADEGQRFFVPPSEAPAGLARGDRVTFDPDAHADPRGPVARRVRILARAVEPPPATTFTDTTITCSECRRPFGWSLGEQVFFRDRGFAAPRRCRDCRRSRTAAASLAPRRAQP
jgi:hypothetical protein